MPPRIIGTLQAGITSTAASVETFQVVQPRQMAIYVDRLLRHSNDPSNSEIPLIKAEDGMAPVWAARDIKAVVIVSPDPSRARQDRGKTRPC
ncbi:hypothetical protein RRG08_000647 [Elysia crispata]|uniref:Uncharacterized protein n=1 Tax=Elysia crispata TaxID=231223 RepID=A0AAE0Y9A7_9GAST|nr:hypothetical protein RRG08_000647 [Elysia crispata]